MHNLKIVILFVLMAYTVYAQSPFLSSSYYYYNHPVLPGQENTPVLHQNADQYVPPRDAMMSVMLRELKENSKRWAETNAAVENIKKEMTNEISNLKNKVAQLQKSADDKIVMENLKKNETGTQTDMLPNEFEPFTFDSSEDGAMPTARFCNCGLIQQTTDKLRNDLAATNVKFTAITEKTIKDLADTKTKFDGITDQTIKDLADASVKFDGIRDDIKKELTTKDDKFTDITNDISADLAATKVTFKGTTNDIDNNLTAMDIKLTGISSKTTTDLAAIDAKLNALITQTAGVDSKPTTIGKEPTSCADLKQLEYKQSGIFSIKRNNQVESVYCDFTKTNSDTDFEKMIGIVDLKTTRVAFHAQLSASYHTAQSTIPFDVIVTNEGGAMSTTTGIFTAPAAGTYFFALSGNSYSTSDAAVKLQKKTAAGSWDSIGYAYGISYTKATFALHSIVSLRKGDEIKAYLDNGRIYDDSEHYTNFVGLLLDEVLI